MMDERYEIRRAMDRHVYWNQFDPTKHHFYKIMKSFRFQLRLPKKFVMKFPEELEKTVRLRGPIGDLREVRVLETEEDVVLREGWGEFVDDHHLNEEDLVIFHYIGNSTFEVFLFDQTGCEKDLRIIQDQLDIKPHFFKMMNMDFRSKLLIPVELARKFPEKLVGKISLKGPSGHVWEVRAVWSEDEDVFLGKGWSEFASDHSLNVFDLLFFRNTGDSSFDVLMFDKTGCEKETSHFVQPKVQQTSDTPGGLRAKEKGKRVSKPDNGEEIQFAENLRTANQKRKGKMGVSDYECDMDVNNIWTQRLPKEVTQAQLNELKLKLKSSQKMATKKRDA